jgi:hypothetical protein
MCQSEVHRAVSACPDGVNPSTHRSCARCDPTRSGTSRISPILRTVRFGSRWSGVRIPIPTTPSPSGCCGWRRRSRTSSVSNPGRIADGVSRLGVVLATFWTCLDLRPTTARSAAVADPAGFSWTRRKNGEVIIEHHGRRAAVLRGRKAQDFVDEVSVGHDQDVMARATGNYKRGNERESRNHPRHR